MLLFLLFLGGVTLLVVDTELEKSRLTSKFVRIPLIIHTTLKRDNSFNLHIEHLQVRRTTISIPRDILSLTADVVGEYIKEVYPTAKSFIIQYEERNRGSLPFCAQIFLSSRIRDGRRHR